MTARAPTGRRTSTSIGVVLLALMVALVVTAAVAVVLLGPDSDDADRVSHAAVAVAALFAAASAARRATDREPPGARSGWWCIAIAAGTWAGTMIGWLLAGETGSLRNTPLWVEAVLAAGALLAAIGTVRVAVAPEHRETRALLGLEAGQMALGAGYLLWLVAIAPALGDLDGYDSAELALHAALPIGTLLVACAALLAGLGRWSGALTALVVAGSAMTAGAVVSIGTSSGSAHLVGELAWALGLLAVAAGSRLPVRRYDPDSPGSSILRAILVFAPIGAGIAVSAWVLGPGGRDLDVVSQMVGVSGGILLVAVQVGLWSESDRLRRRLEANVTELGDARSSLQELLDSIAEAVVVIDLTGTIVDVNLQAEELMGATRAEMIGQTLIGYVPRPERRRLMEAWREILAGAEQMDKPVFPMPRPDGETVMVEANVALDRIRDDGRVVLSLRDVSDRIRAEGEAQAARERFRAAFHAAPTGMALVRAEDGELVEVNPGLAAMLRLPAERLVGSTMAQIVHPDDADRLLDVPSPEEGTSSVQRRYVRGDGTVLWGSTSISLMTDPSGEPMVIAHVLDVTQQMVAAEQLSWSARHDVVTGLANRSHFLERLDESLTIQGGHDVAVLFLDLDRFKVVNDSLGHTVGDELLRTAAERILESVRDGDLVARFGGDEFTVLLTDASLDVARQIADRVRVALAAPVVLGDAEVDVTASIGLAAALGADVTADDMVRDADAAMYRAKEQGRDRVEIFSPETHAVAMRALQVGNELRQALERDEIVPYYQPIVDLRTGRLAGYEVLARWLHPDRGLLMPSEFLAVAEDRGMIVDLGQAILRAALGQFALWCAQPATVGSITLSVNLSARQLTDRGLVDSVAEALAESGVDADRLWLEITESALMTDVRSATSALRDLRSLGLHLAVDDFGTGYSSLTYLKRFPVEAIKVDRTFVAGLGLDTEDSTIVEAVVRLGTSLGLMTVAEGVETPLQLARLREIDCARAQGYLFGRPRPAELLEPFNAVT